MTVKAESLWDLLDKDLWSLELDFESSNKKRSKILISVFIVTRQRPELCQEAVRLLHEKAENPESIEYLLGLDEDDPTLEQMKDFVKQSCISNISITTFKRKPWKNFHEYSNELCYKAVGEWIFCYTDSKQMLTDHWDAVVNKTSKNSVISPVIENHRGHRVNRDGVRKNTYCYTPIIPKWWIEELGFFSDTPHSDTWIHGVSEDCGMLVMEEGIKLYSRRKKDDHGDIEDKVAKRIYQQRSEHKKSLTKHREKSHQRTVKKLHDILKRRRSKK